MAVDRQRLARYVARNLQELPKGAGWSTALRSDGVDTLTEGDYTDSIDYALRQLGFVDEDGLTDATLATESSFDALADIAEGNALERLGNFYMTAVDAVGGPVRTYWSQVSKAIQARSAGSGGRRMARSRLGVATLTSLMED